MAPVKIKCIPLCILCVCVHLAARNGIWIFSCSAVSTKRLRSRTYFSPLIIFFFSLEGSSSRNTNNVVAELNSICVLHRRDNREENARLTDCVEITSRKNCSRKEKEQDPLTLIFRAPRSSFGEGVHYSPD